MQSRHLARLKAVQTSLSTSHRHLAASSLHTSSRMTFAKPADSLKDAKIVSRDPLPEPKWVQLEGIKWKTPDGKEKIWECASRKTRGGSGVDAISVLALISHPSKPLSTVLVLQFRPPANAICVELPAGLVDGDEDPSKAGERELYEETGYEGYTEACSPVIMSDPGMTSANMCVSTVRVELKEGEELVEPKQHLDEGEYIEKRIVAMKDLYQTLLDYDKLGYKVDARLMNLAWGLETARKYQDKF